MAKYKYRKVGAGWGGTLPTTNPSANPTTPFTPAVGTKGCMTCVGVFFPIDDKRCFAAHINCQLSQSIQAGSQPYLVETAEEGKRITKTVLSHLRKDNERHEWGGPSEMMRRNLVLVCPLEWDGIYGEAQVGKYVIDGVLAFLQLGREDVTVTRHHGFVVEPPDWKPRLFKTLGAERSCMDSEDVEEFEWEPESLGLDSLDGKWMIYAREFGTNEAFSNALRVSGVGQWNDTRRYGVAFAKIDIDGS
ncbi:hypothetical protein LTR28_006643 [Elasticomyces elasticus]|nr:hypothetical protein LTR28_006643 [Elasticomyces elasticus]